MQVLVYPRRAPVGQQAIALRRGWSLDDRVRGDRLELGLGNDIVKRIHLSGIFRRHVVSRDKARRVGIGDRLLCEKIDFCTIGRQQNFLCEPLVGNASVFFAMRSCK